MRICKRRWQLVLLLVGAALVVILIARLGPQTVLQELAQAGPGVVWLLVAYAAGTTIAALPWYLLLPDAARPTLRGAIASRFAASASNAALPLLGFGGDATRLLWLRPGTRARGIASLVVDRLLFTAASAVFLLIGLGAVLALTDIPGRYAIAGAAAVALLLFVSGLLAWLSARQRMGGRIHGWLARLGDRSADGDAPRLGDDIDRALIEVWGQRTRLAAAALLLLLARLLLASEIYAALVVLEVEVTLAEVLVLASVPVALSVVASWIPSQLGLQEGALAFTCALLGIPPAVGVAAVLLQRIRQLATVSFGLALAATARRQRAAPQGV